LRSKTTIRFKRKRSLNSRRRTNEKKRKLIRFELLNLSRKFETKSFQRLKREMLSKSKYVGRSLSWPLISKS